MKKLWILLAMLTVSLCLEVSSAEALSLHIMDGDVREVLRSAAKVGQVNLVLDDSVQGTVSVNLENVEPREAIRYISLARGLSLTAEEDTLIVSTPQAIGNGFSGAHVFPLKYAAPDDILAVASLFQTTSNQSGSNGAVAGSNGGHSKNTAGDNVSNGDTVDSNSKSGHVGGKRGANSTNGKNSLGQSNNLRLWTDPGTNSIVVYGTAAQADAVGQLIKQLDVPAKQVALEAQIVSIDKESANNLGVSWEWGSIGKPDEFTYSATINAMVAKGKAEILSRPNVTTVQGREAVINIGGEVPVPSVSVTNSTTTTSLEYRQTGIILRYTPYVNEGGYITANVYTEVSAPQYIKELNAYRFQKRSAETMVRLKDGETMVIGGLIGSEDTQSMSKIPFLGDIPILGNFFKGINKEKKDSEVIIFLTARVLD